ncbi:hypothetical protein LTR84_008378 [Exophiala bonariae]|uniref:Uncharacterized protein n=1 Tax=Exophiala bonariae TaxID=1690606 RepID=A0AAV9MXF4_9EURO|nr:hypothetical protein LTR84_008378 [Exophiala bonariae]
MKRVREVGEGSSESDEDSPAKRVAQDVDIAWTADLDPQPWPEMLTTILGVEEAGDDVDSAEDSDDVLSLASAPQTEHGTKVSIDRAALEEVGTRIDTWAASMMRNQHETVQREFDEMWQDSFDGTDNSQSDRMQCFRMIHNRRARLFGDMQVLRRKLVAINRSEKSWARCTFIADSTTGFLKLDDGSLCAQLDHHLFSPLQTLDQMPSIRILAYVRIDGWMRIIDRAKRPKDAETNVDLNIYGAVSARTAVGDLLSDQGIYLQNPKHCEEDVEYENPHMLALEDVEHDGDEMDVENMDWQPETSRPPDIQQTIKDICSEETRDRQYPEEQEYMHVTVPLLPHQKQAIPFMIEREAGPIPAEHKLWKWTETEAQSGFQHQITKSWTQEPRMETGGGILADDPGMGKTLSMLGLIGRRLADARTWSDNHEDDQPESNVSRLTKVRSNATLVVVPSFQVMEVWLTQVKDFLDTSLQALKYHGRYRPKQVDKVARADIVFTTYHTLATERKANKNILRSIHWFRIILDEAHYIRRQSTGLYAAVNELEACNRWCLTGTPVQNKWEDLGALFAFIRASPFNNISVFRKYVVSTFSCDPVVARQNLSLLMNSVCMRRKIERLKLPPVTERVHYVELSQAERTQYDKTLNSMFWELSHGSREQASGTPFARFQIQLQLRRLCNHGTFQKPWSSGALSAKAQREDIINSLGQDADVMCSLCHGRTPMLIARFNESRTPQQRVQFTCDECTAERFQSADQSSSAGTGDRSYPEAAELLPLAVRENDVGPQGFSAKMQMLVDDVNQDLATTKSIIFSSWTRSLDLVQVHLQRLNIAYLRVDGNTESNNRQPTFDAFNDDESIRVLLMTTGTGAYGLNLTIANRIFILEPQWNPGVEFQAIARAQRLLQKQTVIVTRYVVRGTVEEDVSRQQQSKLKRVELLSAVASTAVVS